MKLERHKEGISKAKAAGKRFGRPATARIKADQVRKLRERGLGASKIARQLGISRASVYRAIKYGTPIDSFKKGFNALLEAAGFVYHDRRDKHALYSLRHSYGTFRLTTKRDKRATSKSLALQMGTSVRMIEKYYGHDEIHDYEDELAGVTEPSHDR